MAIFQAKNRLRRSEPLATRLEPLARGFLCVVRGKKRLPRGCGPLPRGSRRVVRGEKCLARGCGPLPRGSRRLRTGFLPLRPQTRVEQAGGGEKLHPTGAPHCVYICAADSPRGVTARF